MLESVALAIVHRVFIDCRYGAASIEAVKDVGGFGASVADCARFLGLDSRRNVLLA